MKTTFGGDTRIGQERRAGGTNGPLMTTAALHLHVIVYVRRERDTHIDLMRAENSRDPPPWAGAGIAWHCQTSKTLREIFIYFFELSFSK